MTFISTKLILLGAIVISAFAQNITVTFTDGPGCGGSATPAFAATTLDSRLTHFLANSAHSVSALRAKTPRSSRKWQ